MTVLETFVELDLGETTKESQLQTRKGFLAPLWGAYAIPLVLSVVYRVICVHHNHNNNNNNN